MGDDRRIHSAKGFRRALLGSATALGGITLAVVALVPLRSRVTADAAALILVVPVVLGVVVGGLWAAPAGVVVGFLAYDFFFIPPYSTLQVGAGEQWVGLGVYAAVSLAVGAVVGQLQRARAEAQRRALETQVLYDLAQILAAEADVSDALAQVLVQLRRTFGLTSAAVLLPGDYGRTLRVAALDGDPLSEHVLRSLAGQGFSDEVTSLPGDQRVVAVALAPPGGGRGALVVAGPPLDPDARRLLLPFSKQVALALERDRLVREATRSSMLEEVDRLRSTLMGAVSHDLRTPLASIKASVSDLRDPTIGLDDRDRRILLSTIEAETDRLTRFVANVLDLSRIEAGALDLQRSPTPLDELVAAVVERMSPVLEGRDVQVEVPDSLPLVDVDYLLVEQVLANLFENAHRYAPPGSLIEVSAVPFSNTWVEVRVADHGPGIPREERTSIFDLFHRLPSGGQRATGTGLGLAICHGVVTAHGGEIWTEPTAGGGATFVFRLPVAELDMSDPETLDTRAEH